MILLSTVDAIICLFLIKKSYGSISSDCNNRRRISTSSLLNTYPFSFRIRGGADSIITTTPSIDNITSPTSASNGMTDNDDEEQLLQEDIIMTSSSSSINNDANNNDIPIMEEDFIVSSDLTTSEEDDYDVESNDDTMIDADSEEDDCVIITAINETNVTNSLSKTTLTHITSDNSMNDTIVTDDASSSITPIDEYNMESELVTDTSTVIKDDVISPTNDTPTTSSTNNEAHNLRMEGKEYHDIGDYALAIQKFKQAIFELTNPEEETNMKEEEIFQELSTCNLHMALCQLKLQDYKECIQTCTAVLQQEEEINNSNNVTSSNDNDDVLSTAIRARAYHRRAKARYALNPKSKKALEDAKSSAFLSPGNSKSITFYGKLMREHMVVSSTPNSPSSFFPPSNSLFGTSSTTSSSPPIIPNFDSILSNFLPQLSNTNTEKTDNNQNNIVQTIFQSLSSSLQNEDLQQTICSTLNQVSTTQLRSMTSLFLGFDLSTKQASTIVNTIEKIKLTPKKIKRGIYMLDKLYKGFGLLKRVNSVWREYKIFLVYGFIMLWIYKCRLDLFQGLFTVD